MSATSSAFAGDRLAKVIARAGLCSRRDAELWIKDGRVAVNGKVIRTPAFNVTSHDEVRVDGQPLAARQGTRVWLYHKPAGLVVTEKDPEGRPTIFDTLARQGLPRVVSIGRLDINTEGLLLLTNDGGLKRVLELPATGWLRRYRVRAFGTITQPQLDVLKDGLEVEGVRYGPIEAVLEREQGSNVWLLLSLREGKNREVKNVLQALGLKVNRLIRVSFGPFQLGELPIGAVEVVRARVLREQLGKRLADEAGVDFESELPEPAALTIARKATNPNRRMAAPGKAEPKQRQRERDFRFSDRPVRPDRGRGQQRDDRDVRTAERPRRVLHEDGSESEFVPKTYGRKPKTNLAAREAAPKGKRFGGGRPPRDRQTDERAERGPFREPHGGFEKPGRGYGARSMQGEERPKRAFAPRQETDDRPKRGFGDRPRGPRPGGGSKRAARPPADAPRGPRRPGGRPSGKGPRGSSPTGDRPRRQRAPRPPRAE
ncbi:MAG TPA: pseudouridine synthase [Devosia sp.]|nr:pseudouridine synthase [Devosia sp.]